MKKKIVTWTLAISTLLCLLTLTVTAGADTVSCELPRTAKETTLNWVKTVTDDWMKAPTTPVLVGDNIVFVSGDQLIALNKTTGEQTHEVKLVTSPSWVGTQPLYADGKIFVTLTDGYVQAIDASTYKSLWIYKDSLEGQGTTTMTYNNGYLYTGFWNSDSDMANYVCLSAADKDTTKTDEIISAEWTKTNVGGYYNAGASVVGDYLIFGSENGTNYTQATSPSALYCVNKTTGVTVTSAALTGDCRSPILSNGNTIYALTTAGYLYSYSVDATTGALSLNASHNEGYAMTASPVLYKGRLYYGTSNKKFVCSDATTLEPIYNVSLRAYPQASFLLSTHDEAADGSLYFYSTYNSEPGGIQVIKTTATATSGTVDDLYLATGHENYCMSPVLCDSDGTLFYKNDSYTIFSLSKTKITPTPTPTVKPTPTPTPTVKPTTTVSLKKPVLTKVKKLNKKSPYRIKLSWKKVSSAKTYTIYMKKNSGKYKKLISTKKLTYTKTKLKKGTYQFKIKAVTTANKKTYQSKYSNILKVKLK